MPTSHSSLLHDQLRLFVLNDSRAFGEQVSSRLAVELSSHEERDFEDGVENTL